MNCVGLAYGCPSLSFGEYCVVIVSNGQWDFSGRNGERVGRVLALSGPGDEVGTSSAAKNEKVTLTVRSGKQSPHWGGSYESLVVKRGS